MTFMPGALCRPAASCSHLFPGWWGSSGGVGYARSELCQKLCRSNRESGPAVQNEGIKSDTHCWRFMHEPLINTCLTPVSHLSHTCFMTSANDMASSMPGMLPASSVKKESWAHSSCSMSPVSGFGSTSCGHKEVWGSLGQKNGKYACQ